MIYFQKIHVLPLRTHLHPLLFTGGSSVFLRTFQNGDSSLFRQIPPCRVDSAAFPYYTIPLEIIKTFPAPETEYPVSLSDGDFALSSLKSPGKISAPNPRKNRS